MLEERTLIVWSTFKHGVEITVEEFKLDTNYNGRREECTSSQALFMLWFWHCGFTIHLSAGLFLNPSNKALLQEIIPSQKSTEAYLFLWMYFVFNGNRFNFFTELSKCGFLSYCITCYDLKTKPTRIALKVSTTVWFWFFRTDLAGFAALCIS